MRAKVLAVTAVALLAVVAAAPPSQGRDRPFGTSRLVSEAFTAFDGPNAAGAGNSGAGGQFSKEQIERFRCGVTAGGTMGTPTGAMDISCNTQQYRQDFNPDNELAVAVNPFFPGNVVAGSNDYFYRFNNSTGARQALVPTGFFTTFDGGQTWVDGQIPLRSGNGAGDPSPAFSAERSDPDDPHGGWAIMAQLENTGGHGSGFASQGDVSVSVSRNGGLTWSEPTTVFKGQGTGIGPSTGGVFYDKEWLTVDNYPDSPFYGRAYLTTTRFLNGPHGSYAESPIYLAYSDDGGLTWSRPKEISGLQSEFCTYQETGPADECDEDQFSIPEVAPDGTLYVHFANGQHQEAWESPFEFDSQIMVTRSNDGGVTFSDPVHVVDLEDGAGDTAYSVIGSQTVTGHQIRWNAYGSISADPTNPDRLAIAYADNFNTGDSGPAGCTDVNPSAANDYNPCGIDTQTDVYLATSNDGGRTWNERTTIDGSPGDQWFPWLDHRPDGSLAVAYDSNEGVQDPNRNDTFNHVLLVTTPAGAQLSREALTPNGAGRQPSEWVDISVTHWTGQYVPQPAWPEICGPDGYSDPPVVDAEGKDCNVFDGDYTGLAVDREGGIHVVWTGLNRFATSTQVDPYTGGLHDGYAQDAMYAYRNPAVRRR
jgi:BNR/Asp-box repeat